MCLLPLTSLILSICLGHDVVDRRKTTSVAGARRGRTSTPISPRMTGCGQNVGIGCLLRIVLFCKLTACLILVIAFGLPFLVRRCRFSDNGSNVVVSLFFLTVVTPNFFLGRVIKLFHRGAGFCDLLYVTIKLTLV